MDNYDTKEKILNLIRESDDKRLRGRFYRSREYLNRIDFSDVMDIVLYHISLQPDLKKIGYIKTGDFYRMTEHVWEKWINSVKEKDFKNLNGAWCSGPGPMGGTMGEAEFYFSLSPGILRDEYLLDFFNFPRGLPTFFPRWPSYKEIHIEGSIFPKWRRKNKFRKIDAVFSLAEMICSEMRGKG